jgi:hypothetical protein
VLPDLLESWRAIYANHAALRTAVEFAHVGGLLAGGGCAVASDWTILAALRNPGARRAQMPLIEYAHRVVIAGLTAIVLSGVLLFAADVDTYLYSRVYWLKMTLVLLLIVNGAWLWRGERAARDGDPRAWARLRAAATASLTLWFLTTLAGAALPNIG